MSLLILAVSKVRSVLGFFRRVFRYELWNGSPGVFCKDFSAQKCPFCVPKTAKKKVLPVLGFFLEFCFCHGAFSAEFLNSRTADRSDSIVRRRKFWNRESLELKRIEHLSDAELDCLSP